MGTGTGSAAGTPHTEHAFVLHVHYGFVLLDSGGAPADTAASRGGQRNGLCGAALRGSLAMVTGLHTGPVPFSVSIAPSEPPVGPDWEDVVEVSFEALTDRCVLSAFDDHHPLWLRSGTTHRARYCATGMDAANAQDTRSPGDPVLDAYLLQLWPAPPAEDVIVRVTSRAAARWHEVASSTPPPPTDADLAAEVARRRADEAARAEELEARRERRTWGGEIPDDALRAGGGLAAWCARLDRPLAQRIAHLDRTSQRDLALVAAAWATRMAGHGALDWEPALRALAEGTPLPPPFDDGRAAHAALHPGPRTAWFGPAATAPAVRGGIHPSSAALAAVLAAAHPDPAAAVFGALVQAAAAGDDPAPLLAALRAHLGRE